MECQLFSGECVKCISSSYFVGVFTLSTTNRSSWKPNGTLTLLRPSSTGSSSTNASSSSSGDQQQDEWTLSTLSIAAAANDLSWSEGYPSLCAAGLASGKLELFDLNHQKQVVSIDLGQSPLLSTHWASLHENLILGSANSGRIQLLDCTDLRYIVQTFGEVSKPVRCVRWNPHNLDEFASISDDAHIKIWDRRIRSSASTMLDREDGNPLLACDWNQYTDWMLAVAGMNRNIYIWDIRNTVVPLKVRPAHGHCINSLCFHPSRPNTLLSGSSDCTVRVWDCGSSNKPSDGLFLTHEHRHHLQSPVTCVDVSLHQPDSIVSADVSGKVVRISLSDMVYVREVEKQNEILTFKYPNEAAFLRESATVMESSAPAATTHTAGSRLE